MYGGDQHAIKAAGHELKGLMCFYNLRMKDLHFPLMALIDYRGFRVVAMSVLPVTVRSLVYGSRDAGVTVYAKNTALNSLMKQVLSSNSKYSSIVTRLLRAVIDTDVINLYF